MIDSIYLGSLGAGLILLAFVMGQLQVWKNTYFIYDLVNLIGSLLLIYYAWTGHSWPFLILNSVWALISLRDCTRGLQRNFRKTNAMGPWDKWMK